MCTHTLSHKHMYTPTLLSFHLGYKHLFSENDETQMPTAKIEWTKCPRIPLETRIRR